VGDQVRPERLGPDDDVTPLRRTAPSAPRTPGRLLYRHEIEALAAALEAGGHLPAPSAPVATVEQTVAAELNLRTRP